MNSFPYLILQKLIEESRENVKVAPILEPDGVKVETEGGSIGFVVAVEVVLQHGVHLLI